MIGLDKIMYLTLILNRLFVYIFLYLYVSSQLRGSEGRMGGNIIGGKDARIVEFPFAVMLLEYDEVVCGGTIINTWSVMTAAHCFGLPPPTNLNYSDYNIVAGETQIYEWKSRSKYNVSYIITHKKFNTVQQCNDMAMIFVSRPFQFGVKVKKGLLIDHVRWMNDDVRNFTVIGWGVTEGNESARANILMKAQMRYRSHENCGLDEKLAEDRFCLNGDGKTDACWGDSGSAAIWNKYFIVGVVSYGDGPCASLNSTSVFANVFYFRRWIKKAIRKFESFYCENRNLFPRKIKKPNTP